MAEFQAGEVVVPVVPSAKSFITDLKKQVLPAAQRLGQEAGQQIQQGIQAQLRDARVRIGADTSAASAEVNRLRSQLSSLSGQSAQVKVDADTSAASASLAAADAEVARLNGRTAQVQVDVDTGAALGQLAAADAEISRLDGRTANARVDVDVAGALAGIAAVTAALAAVPLAATAALGAGALGGVLATAGAGLAGLAAVAAPSLGRINEALKEQERAATGAASGLSQAAAQTRNLAVEAAQAQIKQLQAANAADQLRAAQDRVKSAAQGVTEAKGRLKSAVAAAGQAQQAAAERAGRAERGLADAQRNALKAQESLNRARQQAAKDLRDLAQQARANSLDQREAALDVVDAEAQLNKVRANKKASAEDIERATIAYERAKLRVEELQTSAQKLAEQQAKGVEGQDGVVAAKDAVEAANAAIIEQESQVAQAQVEAGKAGEDAAKRVEEAKKAVLAAEKRVQDAERGVEQVKRNQKIAALQEKIRKEQAKDAEKRQAQAAKRAAAAAAAGQAKSGQKTADLSPAEAIAAKQIKAFKDSYERFQKELGPAVLPVITGGLAVVEKLFKPLTPLIKGSADALVGLEEAASRALGGKFWTSFFKNLSTKAPTAITGLGKSFGNILVGIAGIVKAFLPFTKTVVGGLQKITGAFAAWGKTLGSSQGFKSFIAYAKANAPLVIALFRNVGIAVGNIITALAPFGRTALAGLTGMATLISRLSPAAIRGIAVAIGAVVLAVKAWAIAQRVLNLVLAANPIGLIIAAIGLVVGAVVAAYAAFPEFKAVVDAAIKGVATAISWAWENVIKPAFEALKSFVMTVIAPAITWLWQNIVVPALQGISAVVSWAWTTIIQPALKALWSFVQNVLAPVFGWLWNSIIVPAWNGISTVVAAAWNGVIQPALKALWSFIQNTLAPKVTWLWESIIKPAFAKAGEAIKAAWTTVIQPALKALWAFITETLAPKVTWLYESVIKPVWAKVGEAIDAAWTKVIKPTFDSLKTFITETIPTAFDKGVGMIKTAWDKIQGYAKKPVQFIVDTVYNGGILKVWNAVAKTLKLPELDEIKFARGGIYPGYTPGRDVGLAAVSGGEAIMRPEWTRAVGENYVHGANAAARKGGVGGVAKFLGVAGDPGGFAGAFAGGGIVGDVKEALAGGIKVGAETLLNPLLAQASAAMGDTPWAKMLTGIPKALIGGVIGMLGEREEKYGGASQHKAVLFARAQIGKPYKWGATGPDSFDCSGLTMRSLQAAGLTDVPRVTYDQINYGKGVASPQAGDLGFPHSGHVWLYSSANKIIEAPYTGASVRETAARTAQAIRRPSYDDGGYLMPGTSLVHNGTGRPEPVLTDRQWRDISRNTSGGDGSLVSIGEMNVTPEQSPYAIAGELRYLLGRGVRAAGR